MATTTTTAAQLNKLTSSTSSMASSASSSSSPMTPAFASGSGQVGQQCILAIEENGEVQSAIGQPFELFGWKEEELVGKSVNRVLDNFFDETLPPSHFWERCLGSGGGDKTRAVKVVKARTRTGETFPATINLSSVKTAGATRFFLGVVERLQDSGLVVVSLHPSTVGNLLGCNHTATELTGYSEVELRGKPLRLLLAHEATAGELCDDLFLLAKLPASAIGDQSSSISELNDKVYHTKLRHRDGTIFPAYVQIRLSQMGSAELLIFWSSSSRTEAGASLNNAEVTIQVSQQGIIIYCNRHFIRPITGREDTELVGQHLETLIPALFPSGGTTHRRDILDTIPSELLHGLPDGIVNYIHNPKRRRLALATEEEWRKEGTVKKVDMVHRDGSTFPAEITVVSHNPTDGVITLRAKRLIDQEAATHNKDIQLKASLRNTTRTLKKVVTNKASGSGNARNKNSDSNSASFSPPMPAVQSTAQEQLKMQYEQQLRNQQQSNYQTFQQPLGYGVPVHPQARVSSQMQSSPPQPPQAIPSGLEVNYEYTQSMYQQQPSNQYFLPPAVPPQRPTGAYTSPVVQQQQPRRVQVQPASSPSPTNPRGNQLQLVGSYVLGERLGKGRFGNVRLATSVLTGERVAIKMMDKESMDPETIDRAIREIEILKQLNHPNIARLYDVVHTDTRINIVMEYVSGGDLHSYMKEKGALTESDARKYFAQIVSAVGYCHSRNILHRDIKQQNILLDISRETVKLIDFGLSNFFEASGQKELRTFCGTPAYAAPEMILRKRYTGPEVDVWSMGVVLYSLITGRFPFNDISTIIAGRFPIPPTISPSCADLLVHMLTVDVSRRAKISDIEHHPWLVGDFQPATFNLSGNFPSDFQSSLSYLLSSQSPLIAKSIAAGGTQPLSSAGGDLLISSTSLLGTAPITSASTDGTQNNDNAAASNPIPPPIRRPSFSAYSGGNPNLRTGHSRASLSEGLGVGNSNEPNIPFLHSTLLLAPLTSQEQSFRGLSDLWRSGSFSLNPAYGFGSQDDLALTSIGRKSSFSGFGPYVSSLPNGPSAPATTSSSSTSTARQLQ